MSKKDNFEEVKYKSKHHFIRYCESKYILNEETNKVSKLMDDGRLEEINDDPLKKYFIDSISVMDGDIKECIINFKEANKENYDGKI